MKIAMIGLRGLPASYGGVEKHVEELGSRIAAAGHQVTVYCRRNYSTQGLEVPSQYAYLPPSGRRPGRYRGMILRNLPTTGGKHLESTVHSGLSALHTLRRDYDIAHFHALGPGLFTPIPRYLTSTRVVQTVHALDDQRGKWSVPTRGILRVGRSLSAWVPDDVIVVSRELARIYDTEHDRPAHYIPNGAPRVEPVPPGAVLRRYGLEPGRYLLFLGRFVPEKCPDLLVRAFARLPADVKLVLVGGSSHSDDYADDLRRLATADPRIVMPGYVFGSVLAELMSSAALFIQPSRLEGMPITVLEAAAYGLPVVASDIGPHREILQASGPGHRLFPDGSVAGLAEAIRAELADRDAGAVGAAELHRRTQAHYDWDDVVERTLSVYRNTLAR